MSYSGRLDLSPSHRAPIETDGVKLWKTMILDVDPASHDPAPSGHLIEQAPGETIRAHFHACPQFQVIVNGSGLLGRAPVAPFLVHYTRSHTGYGPIVAGERGMWYLTLRPSPRFPAQYLPESREALHNGQPKFQVTSELCPPGTANATRPLVEMIAPRPDGLAVWAQYVAPDTQAAPPRHVGGAARYYLVTRGELLHEGRPHGYLSLLWTEPDDDFATLQAGPAGLELIIMQFPGDAF